MEAWKKQSQSFAKAIISAVQTAVEAMQGLLNTFDKVVFGYSLIKSGAERLSLEKTQSAIQADGFRVADIAENNRVFGTKDSALPDIGLQIKAQQLTKSVNC